MSYQRSDQPNTLSATEVDHLLSTRPWALCTTEYEINQETLELHQWLEPWNAIGAEELLGALHSGHFYVERSLDGKLRLWPNYGAYEAIPVRLHVLREMAHLGLILDVLPTQCSVGEAVHRRR